MRNFIPRFYCGYLDAIEIFDLNLPGEGTRLLTRPTKKSKDGVRGTFLPIHVHRADHLIVGIISAIDFCPDYSGLFAAGTFTSSIGIFSEDTGSQVLRYLDDIPGPISQVSSENMESLQYVLLIVFCTASVSPHQPQSPIL
jgi:hypothetical protein